MADAQAAFLDAASTALHLLERGELAERWQQDSVLPQFPVAALAGHLLRGMTTVEQYLDGPEPDEAGISAARYFHTVIRSADINDPAHQAIRGRGADAAAAGPAALASDARAALGRLSPRLAGVGAGRRLRVAGGLVMTLDEYLRTRVVELVIHADDLAASLGAELAPPRPATCAIAIDVLVGVARIRHGDMAVLRALVRRGILASMPELIGAPSRVAAAGEPPKLIDEYVGRASTGETAVSVAHMRSPSGWAEPGQRPEFGEFTIVLRGALVVEFEGGQLTVEAGQGVQAKPGEWVRYSTPGGGAEYISVCLPAFAPGTVHRDDG
jgi:hypothetical protein